MERFYLSFDNRYVRIYFATVLPLILVAIMLYLFLPTELHLIPTLLVLVGTAGYFTWYLIQKNKKRKR